MAFDALELAIQLAAALRQPLARLRQCDPRLAAQADEAADSIALNLAEGRYRAGRDRLHLFRVAQGSAGELRAALRLAGAKGHLTPPESTAPLALLDRLLAMCWRLTRH